MHAFKVGVIALIVTGWSTLSFAQKVEAPGCGTAIFDSFNDGNLTVTFDPENPALATYLVATDALGNQAARCRINEGENQCQSVPENVVISLEQTFKDQDEATSYPTAFIDQYGGLATPHAKVVIGENTPAADEMSPADLHASFSAIATSSEGTAGEDFQVDVSPQGVYLGTKEGKKVGVTKEAAPDSQTIVIGNIDLFQPKGETVTLSIMVTDTSATDDKGSYSFYVEEDDAKVIVLADSDADGVADTTETASAGTDPGTTPTAGKPTYPALTVDPATGGYGYAVETGTDTTTTADAGAGDLADASEEISDDDPWERRGDKPARTAEEVVAAHAKLQEKIQKELEDEKRDIAAQAIIDRSTATIAGNAVSDAIKDAKPVTDADVKATKDDKKKMRKFNRANRRLVRSHASLNREVEGLQSQMNAQILRVQAASARDMGRVTGKPGAPTMQDITTDRDNKIEAIKNTFYVDRGLSAKIKRRNQLQGQIDTRLRTTIALTQQISVLETALDAVDDLAGTGGLDQRLKGDRGRTVGTSLRQSRTAIKRQLKKAKKALKAIAKWTIRISVGTESMRDTIARAMSGGDREFFEELRAAKIDEILDEEHPIYKKLTPAQKRRLRGILQRKKALNRKIQRMQANLESAQGALGEATAKIKKLNKQLQDTLDEARAQVNSQAEAAVKKAETKAERARARAAKEAKKKAKKARRRAASTASATNVTDQYAAVNVSVSDETLTSGGAVLGVANDRKVFNDVHQGAISNECYATGLVFVSEEEKLKCSENFTPDQPSLDLSVGI